MAETTKKEVKEIKDKGEITEIKQQESRGKKFHTLKIEGERYGLEKFSLWNEDASRC